MCRSIYALLLILFMGLLSPAAGLAHKVNIFAYIEGGSVYSESYFPDGRPVESGTVRVYDPDGQMLLEGRTDNTGLFNFPTQAVSPLVLEIDAGMGHKNRFELKKTASDE